MTAVSGLLIVDKPAGMTSHDVVARVRRLAATRRVGHAGTLDPMATGVLVVGVGKATRLLGHLMLTEKTYAATIRLGQSTTTDDAEGEPSGGSRACDVPAAALRAGIARLTGEIMQVPPGVSAIKVGGERAYKLTRSGQSPELKPRPVTVYEFTVTAVRQAGEYLDVDAVIRCSSGTYIRALARDLGADLATGGHLTALRRTAVGPYRLDQAHTLEDLEKKAPSPERTGLTSGPESASARFPPVTPLAEAAAAAFPKIVLTADEARRLAQGARLPIPPAIPTPVPANPPAPEPSSWPTPVPANPPAPEPSGWPTPVPANPPAPEPSGWPAPGPASSPAPVPASPPAPEPVSPPASVSANPASSLARPAPLAPIAAFDPEGTLVALVTAESGQLRSLAVFA